MMNFLFVTRAVTDFSIVVWAFVALFMALPLFVVTPLLLAYLLLCYQTEKDLQAVLASQDDYL